MVDIEKMNLIIKDKLEHYRLYEDKIQELEELKNCDNKNTDVNSWIRSVNKTSHKTMYSALYNVKDKLFAIIIKNKYIYHLAESYNIEFSGVSRSTYYKYLQIIYCQIGVNAIQLGLITFDEIML